MKYEIEYRNMLAKALLARPRQTRNAITRSYFGDVLEIDTLELEQFPILLGRKMYWPGVVGEMATFLKGPSHVTDFRHNNCNYWDGFADENGDLRIDYGNAWLDFNGVNQLEEVVKSLRSNPYGRRHLISAWRPDKLNQLSLPCCHYSYQWYVNDDNELEMIWNQRSVDLAIGLPSDIILAALFNILMAQTVDLKPGKITMMLGDCHIYESHLEGVAVYMNQLSKKLDTYSLPSYYLDAKATVFNFRPSMFATEGYKPKDPINFKLEV